ncbi:YolD-like family protein [Alicyclobacillus ferrooxydans]|uniref:YolD-like family protein n=1 Tax=Alicyclobacillus ferrooxydans TaxID=471514 RepID=A0A0N8PP28_9BACL|nr:YolD-like family protein [Alicyclobacillus ferrooxydans]KPV43165.1 hypothetical protein AN477_13835 [Alicyclobacillus ferrooxydans]
MNINEGNIFEAMRLVLPEHRGVMSDWNRQRSASKPTALTEDEMEQIQYVLSEAVENRAKVRVTLFGDYGDMVLEGVPVYDGRLRIVTDGGIQSVDVDRLIKAEMV